MATKDTNSGLLSKMARFVRNPTKDCLWDCPFNTICKGELDGLDMDFTKDELFVKEEQLDLFAD